MEPNSLAQSASVNLKRKNKFVNYVVPMFFIQNASKVGLGINRVALFAGQQEYLLDFYFYNNYNSFKNGLAHQQRAKNLRQAI